VLRRLKSMARWRIGRLAARVEARPDFILPVDYGDGDLFIYADSDFERSTRTTPCAKEPDTIKWIHTLMKPGDVVFDIGANVGNYSLIIAKHLDENVQVFAFEPAWFNFMQLNRNVKLNGMDRCVFPICAALSSENGINWLNYSTLEYGSSMHSLGKAVKLKKQTFTPVLRQPVPSFTMDRAVEFLARVPNHIKIDVDGIENEVLAGAASTLQNSDLRSLLVELSSEDPEDQKSIESILGAGFKIWNVQEKPRNEFVNYAAHANYIFVR
jgi:FkbM family methyltransferase